MSSYATHQRIDNALEQHDIQDRYGVQVTVVDAAEGIYNIQALGDRDGVTELGEIGYSVNVRALQGDVSSNPNLAAELGVPYTGDPTTDFGNMSEALFNQSPAAASFDEDFPGFQDSALHRVAVVAAFVRSGGNVLPEAFARDPSFGAAGAGPEILPVVGGEGQILSKTGIAHDADWALGAMGTKGPMWALGTVQGEIPSGLHGLRNAEFQLETLEAFARGGATVPGWLGGKFENLEAWANGQLTTLDNQRGQFEDGRLDGGALPPYDRGWGVQDWDVGMYQVQRRNFWSDPEVVPIIGQADTADNALVATRLDTSPDAMETLDTYLKEGGNPETAAQAMAQSRYPEDASNTDLGVDLPGDVTLSEPVAHTAVATHAETTHSETTYEAEDDYGLV